MRKTFAEELYKTMSKNNKVYLLVGDLGFGYFDKIREDFPDRYINCGASEQSMIGIAVGLALEGKIPFVYTITSFYLRAAETINLYLHHEQVPVKLIGSGLFNDYEHDGYSHDGTQAQKFIQSLNIEWFATIYKKDIKRLLFEMMRNNKPSFIGLRRG